MSDARTASVLLAVGRLRSAHRIYLATTGQRELTAAIDAREAALRQAVAALDELDAIEYEAWRQSEPDMQDDEDDHQVAP